MKSRKELMSTIAGLKTTNAEQDVAIKALQVANEARNAADAAAKNKAPNGNSDDISRAYARGESNYDKHDIGLEVSYDKRSIMGGGGTFVRMLSGLNIVTRGCDYCYIHSPDL